jgi:hypothetical protein
MMKMTGLKRIMRFAEVKGGFAPGLVYLHLGDQIE